MQAEETVSFGNSRTSGICWRLAGSVKHGSETCRFQSDPLFFELLHTDGNQCNKCETDDRKANEVARLTPVSDGGNDE